MPLSVRLGYRDYDAALGLVAEAADTSGAQPFELPAIEGLLRLIPADRADYFEYGDGASLSGRRTRSSSIIPSSATSSTGRATPCAQPWGHGRCATVAVPASPTAPAG